MVLDKFKILKKVCVITGGAGLLGQKHAEAVIEDTAMLPAHSLMHRWS